jgi:hypothetical protein
MTNMEYVEMTHVGEATTEWLWSHTVGICNGATICEGVDPSSGLRARELGSPGTGVAGGWGRHTFILTARHVLEDASPQHLSFFARPIGTIIRSSHATMDESVTSMPLECDGVRIYRCDSEDLAVVTLQPGALGAYLEFADIHGFWSDPSEGDPVFGLGYPVSSAPILQRQVGQSLEKAVLLTPTPFFGHVISSSQGTSFSQYDPDRHYLMPYNLASEGKHPRGISGAAVWMCSPLEQVIWSTRLRFAGICTSCYRNGSIEQVVKASFVRQFLWDIFGDPEE